MTRVHRARLALVAAAVLSLAIVVVELPLSTLVHQRGALAAASEHLAAVEAKNARLTGQIARLRKPSTVASIAHAEYGLVKPGQVEYEIPHLPGVKGGGSRLATSSVPAGDLVPPAASPLGSPPSPPPGTTSRERASLWSQVLHRLAFWRGVF